MSIAAAGQRTKWTFLERFREPAAASRAARKSILHPMIRAAPNPTRSNAKIVLRVQLGRPSAGDATKRAYDLGKQETSDVSRSILIVSSVLAALFLIGSPSLLGRTRTMTVT